MSARTPAAPAGSRRHAAGAEIGDIVTVNGRTGELIGSTDGRPVVRPFPIAEQADWPGQPAHFVAEGELRIVKKHWEWANSAVRRRAQQDTPAQDHDRRPDRRAGVRKLLHLAGSAGERLRSFAQPAAGETVRAADTERNEITDAFRAWAEARDPERALRELADADPYSHDRTKTLQIDRMRF